MTSAFQEHETIPGVEDAYDIAQVCPNGHVANASTREWPHRNRSYCEKCGEATITQCTSRQRPIRGEYISSAVVLGFEYHPPAYCRDCGKPFP